MSVRRYFLPAAHPISVTDTTEAKERARVLVRLANGRTIHVEAYAVYGDYAVHPWVSSQVIDDRGFTVTHRPSGLSIWSVAQYVDALRVASYLQTAALLPSDPLSVEHIMQEALADKASESAQRMADVRSRLEKIAVRVRPPQPQPWYTGVPVT